jgi:hypothetical protein
MADTLDQIAERSGQEQGQWVERSRFWHPNRTALPPIVMITVFCDESYDAHTYALAGWIAPPAAWDRFDVAWRAMLSRFKMPDGSPVPGFHSSEIVCRDEISDSRFKGWTFDDETAIFRAAVDVLATEPLCANVWSVGCCVDTSLLAVKDRDEIWHMMFGQLMMELILRYPVQNGFDFMFDDKPEVMARVTTSYKGVKDAVNELMPGKLYGSVVAFGSDEAHPALQAADLMAYEWRRNVSEQISKPSKPPRRSYVRLRGCREKNSMLRYYDKGAMSEAIERAKRNGYTSLLRSIGDSEHG